MVFEKHGEYKLEIKDGVLIVDATGPFNDEVVISYQNDLETCIRELEDRCWGQVVTLRELSLFTPDAEQSLINSLGLRKARGLKFSAVVCDSPYSLVRMQISRIYDGAGILHKFFESESSALSWINEYANQKCA